MSLPTLIALTMFKYTVLVLCFLAVLIMASAIEYGSNQCCCGNNYGSATAGRSFEVISSSSKPPTGLAVLSENAYEGNVDLGGKLPFVGSAAVEGVVPTEGCSKICYGCGTKISIERERGCGGAAGIGGCGCGSPENWGWSVSL